MILALVARAPSTLQAGNYQRPWQLEAYEAPPRLPAPPEWPAPPTRLQVVASLPHLPITSFSRENH